jgi:hypothetical protein
MTDVNDRLTRVFGEKFVNKYKASMAKNLQERRKINLQDRRKIMMLVKENFDGDQTSLSYNKGTVGFDIMLATTPAADRWREYEFPDAKSISMSWKSTYISAVIPKGPLLEIIAENTPYILVGSLRPKKSPKDGRIYYSFYVSDIITMEELEDFKPSKSDLKEVTDEHTEATGDIEPVEVKTEVVK